MLNSKWSKFDQWINNTEVPEFTDQQPFLKFQESNAHDVRYVSAPTEEEEEAHFKQVASHQLPSLPPNVFVASYTTCHAHLSLYELLHHLQEWVLYLDTNSVIYLQRPSNSPLHPPHGNYLGEFKDELNGIT